MSIGAKEGVAKVESKSPGFDWSGIAGFVLNIGGGLLERKSRQREAKRQRDRENRLFQQQATRQGNRPPPVAVEQLRAGFSFFDIPLLGPLLKALFGG